MRWKGRWAKATQLKGTLKEVESNEPRALVTDWWPTSVSSLLPRGTAGCHTLKGRSTFCKAV